MEPLPPEALLAGYPDAMRDIGAWLRGVVRRALPDVLERVRPGWSLIGYDVRASPRRTAYFAWVALEPIHVHLGFVNGVLMADPRGLLQGRGITRKARWVTLTPDAMLPERHLAELVREGARVATLSRAERALLALDRGDDSSG